MVTFSLPKDYSYERILDMFKTLSHIYCELVDETYKFPDHRTLFFVNTENIIFDIKKFEVTDDDVKITGDYVTTNPFYPRIESGEFYLVPKLRLLQNKFNKNLIVAIDFAARKNKIREEE